MAQVGEHGFYPFKRGVVEEDIPLRHVTVKAPGILRQKVHIVLQHLVNAGSVLL